MHAWQAGCQQTQKLSQKLLDVCYSSTCASKEKQLCATRVDGDVVTSPRQSEFFSSATDQETEGTSMPFRSKTLWPLARPRDKCVTAVASREICRVGRTYALKDTAGLEKR